MRLLCVPALTDVEGEWIAQSEAVQRAKEYVVSTPFTIDEAAAKRRARIERG